MAVEAPHLNPFPPSQILANRDFMGFNELGQIGSTVPLTQSAPQRLVPFYQSLPGDSIPVKSPAKPADSGLTHNLTVPRKRTRETMMMNQLDAAAAYRHKNYSNTNTNSSLSHFSSSLLGEDISRQFLQQQSEIDSFIADQTEKVRFELSERRNRHSLVLAAAIEEAIAKRLKDKDDEIDRLRKVNWFLQDRVKGLCVENSVWKDIAQKNEAAANSLRSNLEHVLAHVADDRHDVGISGAAGAVEDCVSSCGSVDHVRETKLRTSAEEDDATTESAGSGDRLCRKCGVKESRVLLLPCRHLCLCTTCGSSLRVCPVCHATMNASVHVNMS